MNSAIFNNIVSLPILAKVQKGMVYLNQKLTQYTDQFVFSAELLQFL